MKINCSWQTRLNKNRWQFIVEDARCCYIWCSCGPYPIPCAGSHPRHFLTLLGIQSTSPQTTGVIVYPSLPPSLWLPLLVAVSGCSWNQSAWTPNVTTCCWTYSWCEGTQLLCNVPVSWTIPLHLHFPLEPLSSFSSLFVFTLFQTLTSTYVWDFCYKFSKEVLRIQNHSKLFMSLVGDSSCLFCQNNTIFLTFSPSVIIGRPK